MLHNKMSHYYKLCLVTFFLKTKVGLYGKHGSPREFMQEEAKILGGKVLNCRHGD